MIGYVTVGTNDMPRAVAFYDALLAELGAQRFMETDTFVAWSAGPDKPGFSVTQPWDGKAATVGNGCMTAFAAGSTDAVDRLYARAIELGATDEGPAGPRSGGFYAGYFRDLDGNKLNVFHFAGE